MTLRMSAGALAALALIGCGMMMVNEQVAAPPGSASGTRPAGSRIAAGCASANHEYDLPLGQNIIPDHAPEAKTKVPPEYPEAARQAHVDGTVVMTVLVCEHGGVLDARVTRSIPMLDTAALDAVSYWKFQPALLGGKPVPTWIELPLKFTLN